MKLDSVQIGSVDLEHDVSAYEVLLGVPAVQHVDGARRFQLHRGAVELEVGSSGLSSLRFASDGAGSAATTETINGLRIRFDAPVASPSVAAPAAVDGIDHVVIHSPDLERAIAVWRDRFGLRLALDRTFPARGLRMLFFRSGGITLEVVGALTAPPDPAAPDRFYGMAYRVDDLGAYRKRLLAAGVDVSEIRDGNKPDTRVATLRSGTAGVPTLLIQPHSSAA
jgi:catechol 2,3-dioxygenase-like lactoylglutathione lyase family enzyme